MTDGIDTAGADSLHIVDSALFMVCLDHYSPHTLSELSRNILHGTSEVDCGVQSTLPTNDSLIEFSRLLVAADRCVLLACLLAQAARA